MGVFPWARLTPCLQFVSFFGISIIVDYQKAHLMADNSALAGGRTRVRHRPERTTLAV